MILNSRLLLYLNDINQSTTAISQWYQSVDYCFISMISIRQLLLYLNDINQSTTVLYQWYQSVDYCYISISTTIDKKTPYDVWMVFFSNSRHIQCRTSLTLPLCLYRSQEIERSCMRVLTVLTLPLFLRLFVCILVDCFIWFLVFNATFSNISAISWRPVLMVEEAGVPGENHRPWTSNCSTLSLAAASRVHSFL